MPKSSYIQINAREITPSDLKAMLQSQAQIVALTEMAEAARNSKIELGDKTFSDHFLAKVKTIIS